MSIERVIDVKEPDVTYLDNNGGDRKRNAVSAWFDKFSFNGKMGFLLLGIIVLTLLGNMLTAHLVYDEIRVAIETGLVNQVQGQAHSLAADYKNRSQAEFIALATAALEKNRWGEQGAGYFFLADAQANILVYPPDHQRIGKKLDDVMLYERNESLNQALIRIARSGEPSLVTYPYVKPADQQRILKTAYIYPLGQYLLVGGIYLDSADNVFYNYLKHSGVILVSTLVILLALIGLFSRSFSHHVRVVLNGLQEIASKRLANSVCSHGKDEIAVIIRAMENTRLQLVEILYSQRDSADNLTAVSTQIGTGIADVNISITEQRQRLDNLASAMEQMSASIREVTQSAQLSAEGAKKTDKLANDGAETINKTIVAINCLFENLNNSSDSVSDVDEKVIVIGSIIETINSISEQTNLLALNAAIEAARAGEQGRGFSVVADEVRTLAKRTKAATYEISEMIVGLQQSTTNTVQLMQQSIHSAEQAKQDATIATECFAAIMRNTGELSSHCQLIAAAVEEQTLVTADVSQSLQVIQKAVQGTELVSTDLHITSQYMQRTAEQINEIVRAYDLP